MKLALLIFTIPFLAQSQDMRVTADLLSVKTTTAMFGRLPKPYSAASVSICSNSASAVTVPLARASQQIRTGGFVILSRDAAISVIAAAQGGSAGAIALRAGIAIVGFAALAATWSGASTGLKNTLTSGAIVGAGGIGILSTAIPTHTYLTFDHEALPDPLQIPALGCASGIAIVESVGINGGHVDVGVSLPSGATTR